MDKLNEQKTIQVYDDMLDFNRKHKEQAKDLYRDMQLWQLKNGNGDGVFCPFSVVSDKFRNAMMTALLTGFVKSPKVEYAKDKQLYYINTSTMMHVYGAWRNTLSIYKIDSDIYKQIKKSPIPLDTPMSIYSRLPEWCVYVELPQDANFCKDAGLMSVKVEKARGFWAYLDYHDNKNRKLCLVMDYQWNEEQGEPANAPFELLIDTSETLQQALEVNKGLESKAMERYKNIDLHEAKAAEDIVQKSKQRDKDIVFIMLSLLLWLCAEEPDITNIQGEPITGEQLRLPNYSRNKKTGRFIPPSQPSVYHLGKRLGGEIRQFNDKYGKSDSRISSRKRPHIRRGHWHGVWKGTGQDKQFKIYWQPAIFVNATI